MWLSLMQFNVLKLVFVLLLIVLFTFSADGRDLVEIETLPVG